MCALPAFTATWSSFERCNQLLLLFTFTFKFSVFFFSFTHLGTEHSKYRLSCSYSVYINEFVNVCDGIVISLFFMCAFKSCFWYCCCGCWCCRKAFHSLKLIMNTLDFILNRRWSCQPFPIVNELASFLHLSSACFWWSISETRASSVGGFP